MEYRFKRADVRLPVVKLEHLELQLSFFETHVDGSATLTLTAKEPLGAVELDARDLEVFEVTSPDAPAGCAYALDAARHKLTVTLPRPVAAA